jgi:hypothetical protein
MVGRVDKSSRHTPCAVRKMTASFPLRHTECAYYDKRRAGVPVLHEHSECGYYDKRRAGVPVLYEAER